MANLVDKAKNFVAEKVANMKKPEANLADVSVKGVSRDSAIFHGQVAVNNPYSHDLPIGEITYTLKSADRVIASGTMLDPGSISANNTTELDIPVKVPYNVLISLARDIGADWDIDYEFEVGLVMDLPIIGNLTIPVSRKGEIKLPTFSDLF
ncbi:late embryogenesis abundant protein Lea14-A [Cinnamomum micranthum f. kanehirae]|uniref:Late embryogenesis abundant protein Lea14-A n=1 Tax=Cinnamomum micranthum f. kanehirae TaxID=337451 RepID=A0A443NNY2_9MAGN|nr:late embryogenesis abundant protein Lea14-A [Cinnamomum micranthum f. kanehirae]